jgi:large subunit ribosomal protein L32
MAHPKRKISKTRRDKRRTHYKIAAPTIAVCPTTGEAHLWHRGYWHEGKLYYKGRVVADKTVEAEA